MILISFMLFSQKNRYITMPKMFYIIKLFEITYTSPSQVHQTFLQGSALGDFFFRQNISLLPFRKLIRRAESIIEIPNGV